MLITIFYSLCILTLALMAYVLIREEIISLNGVQGRDSILVPFGLALLIYSLLNFVKSKYKHYLYVVVVALGISSFNMLYLEWQKDYYYQLAMERLFVNETIKDNDTFFLADLNESKVKGQRFYSLNANAYNVYNDETRLFIPKVSNLYLLNSESALKHAIEALDYAYMMKDYKPDDRYLDAVIVYNCDLNYLDTIRLKYYEMFDNNRFVEHIDRIGKMDVYVVDDDFTKLLLEEYEKMNLKSDEDVLLLLDYYND